MTRQQIRSSAIKSAGHDAATLTLEIEFTSGTVYQYAPVARETFDALVDPKISAGGVFFRSIRNNPAITSKKAEPAEAAS